MKIALLGYGKMGRLLDQLAPAEHDEVVLRLTGADNAQGMGINAARFANVDVAIDFSTPAAVLPNVRALAAIGINVVVGTTGWSHQAGEVRSLVEAAPIGLVWSPNFSIGVNVFQRLVAQAAQLLAEDPQYEAWAWEIHHSAKKDAPSGTLLKLVERMRQSGWERAIDQASNRAGAMPGTHEIGFDSAADTITLRHTARNREGFASGALRAAHWIHGKRGFHEFGEIIFQ